MVYISEMFTDNNVLVTKTESRTIAKAHFRKAGHVCDITKEGRILVNLEQFEDETPLSSM